MAQSPSWISLTMMGTEAILNLGAVINQFRGRRFITGLSEPSFLGTLNKQEYNPGFAGAGSIAPLCKRSRTDSVMEAAAGPEAFVSKEDLGRTKRGLS